jgi:hypothetical protein
MQKEVWSHALCFYKIYSIMQRVLKVSYSPALSCNLEQRKIHATFKNEASIVCDMYYHYTKEGRALLSKVTAVPRRQNVFFLTSQGIGFHLRKAPILSVYGLVLLRFSADGIWGAEAMLDLKCNCVRLYSIKLTTP